MFFVSVLFFSIGLGSFFRVFDEDYFIGFRFFQKVFFRFFFLVQIFEFLGLGEIMRGVSWFWFGRKEFEDLELLFLFFVFTVLSVGVQGFVRLGFIFGGRQVFFCGVFSCVNFLYFQVGSCIRFFFQRILGYRGFFSRFFGGVGMRCSFVVVRRRDVVFWCGVRCVRFLDGYRASVVNRAGFYFKSGFFFNVYVCVILMCIRQI